MSTRNQKLMDEVHAAMRLKHYSIHTERSYSDWIKRFVHFHGMKSCSDLQGGEPKIEAFLTHLALKEQVSPSTQNQAMNALVFLQRGGQIFILDTLVQEAVSAVRFERPKHV